MNKPVIVLSALSSTVMIFFAAPLSAQDSLRRPVDPNDPFARRSGLLSQLPSVYVGGLPANESRGLANATIISPCRIITNYHVAFGKSKNTETNKIVMVKNRVKGHQVNFAFDIDATTGQFKRTMKASVIGFANYMNTPRGMLGDMAVLELESCLDQKEYEQLDLSIAASTEDNPLGSLKTVSVSQNSSGKVQVLVQEGCKSLEGTPVDGLFIATCEAVPGMSGSAVYEKGMDNKWHWTGLTTKKSNDQENNNVLIAINARTIATFFNRAFGGSP